MTGEAGARNAGHTYIDRSVGRVNRPLLQPVCHMHPYIVLVCSLQDTTTLQWSPPADNGAVVSCYQLEVDDGRQGEFRLAYTGPETHCIVQQLQVGSTGAGGQYSCW